MDQADVYSTRHERMLHLELEKTVSSVRLLLQIRSRRLERRGRRSRTILRSSERRRVVDPDSICEILIISLYLNFSAEVN